MPVYPPPGDLALQSAAKVVFGGDTNLYRHISGNELVTDDVLQALGGFQNGTFTIDKAFQVTGWLNTNSNEKADLYFTGSVTCRLEITVIANWSTGNAIGTFTAVYDFSGNATGTIFQNDVNYTVAQGNLPTYFGLGPVTWDATNSRWKIPIVHRTASTTVITVMIRAQGTGPADANNLRDSLGVTAIYTTDATTVTAPAVSFDGPVSVGKVGPSSAAGIVIGTDVNLYRNAADTLRTDDSMQVAGANGVASDVHGTVSGGGLKLRPGAASNANSELRVTAGTAGTSLTFVSETGTADTNLYRSAADILATDDDLLTVRGVSPGPVSVLRSFYFNFNGAVANEKADIYFGGPANIAGAIEVTVSGILASGAGAQGVLQAIYHGGWNTAGSMSQNGMIVTQAAGAIPAQFALMPIAWDATNSRYKLTIGHLTTSANEIGVSVRFFAGATAYADRFRTTCGASALYTTDTTVPAALVAPGDWQTYTPTIGGTGWALGNGTLTAKYTKIGHTVHWWASIVWGSTSTFGASASMTLALPMASTSGALYRFIGSAVGLRVGTNDYHFRLEYASTSSVVPIQVAANGAASVVTATSPVTWASGDTFTFSGTYEAA